jgi:hypothetical protein
LIDGKEKYGTPSSITASGNLQFVASTPAPNTEPTLETLPPPPARGCWRAQ